MARIEVQITQQHIDQGEQASCTMCPYAIAVDDILDDEYCAAVYTTSAVHIETWLGRRVKKSHLDREDTDIIRRYDIGRSMQPHAFTIDIPRKYLKVA